MVFTQHYCAQCASDQIRRNGHSGGRAKYQCKSCGHQGYFRAVLVEEARRYSPVKRPVERLLPGAPARRAGGPLSNSLSAPELEPGGDKKALLIEKIKAVLSEMVYGVDELPKIKTSQYITEQIKYDYSYLAVLFSKATGTTIEQQVIALKIDRVKELLLKNEFNITQISFKLNYSSVAHLSNQFKKITGFTPTFFKQIKPKETS